MSTLCYCCEQLGTTNEHVPPECLFPERKDLPPGVDLRRNLITIPSCPTHNLEKSGDDEYLMYVLTMNLSAEKIAEYHFSTKVLRSINRRPSLINRILAKTSPITIHDTESNEVFDTAAIEVEGSRVERVLSQVALGLYRHHIGRPWSGPLRILPEFLRFLQDAKSSEWNAALQQMGEYANDLFREALFHGENQDVFKYQVVFPGGQIPAAFRMHFYGGVKVLAFFGMAGG
jgi:hypothetical protein